MFSHILFTRRSFKKILQYISRFKSGHNNFYSCQALEILQLSRNLFEESIESSIENAKNLKILYLHRNKLKGNLPEEICSLTKLQRLNLSYNNFEGILPENIGQLSETLESFMLTDNDIKGPVPASLKELKNLKDFHIFKDYPSELPLPMAFNKKAFQKIYEFGPSFGINSVHWTNDAKK